MIGSAFKTLKSFTKPKVPPPPEVPSPPHVPGTAEPLEKQLCEAITKIIRESNQSKGQIGGRVLAPVPVAAGGAPGAVAVPVAGAPGAGAAAGAASGAVPVAGAAGAVAAVPVPVPVAGGTRVPVPVPTTPPTTAAPGAETTAAAGAAPVAGAAGGTAAAAGAAPVAGAAGGTAAAAGGTTVPVPVPAGAGGAGAAGGRPPPTAGGTAAGAPPPPGAVAAETTAVAGAKRPILPKPLGAKPGADTIVIITPKGSFTIGNPNNQNVQQRWHAGQFTRGEEEYFEKNGFKLPTDQLTNLLSSSTCDTEGEREMDPKCQSRRSFAAYAYALKLAGIQASNQSRIHTSERVITGRTGVAGTGVAGTGVGVGVGVAGTGVAGRPPPAMLQPGMLQPAQLAGQPLQAPILKEKPRVKSSYRLLTDAATLLKAVDSGDLQKVLYVLSKTVNINTQNAFNKKTLLN